MKCTWYVQTNLSQNGSARLEEACIELGQPFHGFRVRPFTSKMARLGAREPFVLSGSTTLNRNAAKSIKYRNGIFFNPKTFRPSMYAKGYGKDYLNHDSRILKIKDIGDNDYDLDETLFIRSNDDSKNISGGTLQFQELLKIKNNTQEYYVDGDIFTPKSEVCIASEKHVGSEWRLIFVKGKVIASSQYRPSVDPFVPDDVKTYAAEQAQKWAPHDVFVMDVCFCDGELKVVECN